MNLFLGLLDANAKPVDTGVTRYKVKESDSEYIRLAKTGGHASKSSMSLLFKPDNLFSIFSVIRINQNNEIMM